MGLKRAVITEGSGPVLLFSEGRVQKIEPEKAADHC